MNDSDQAYIDLLALRNQIITINREKLNTASLSFEIIAATLKEHDAKITMLETGLEKAARATSVLETVSAYASAHKDEAWAMEIGRIIKEGF